MSDSEKQDKPTFSFKKINRKRAVRKQRNESSDDGSGKSDSDDGNVAVRQMVTKKKNNPMVQSTKRLKLGTTGVTNSSSDDNSDQDTASITVSYKSSRSGKREGPDDMGATSVMEIDTQADRDAQAILERSLQLQKELKEKEDDKIYRGINNYHQYYEIKDSIHGNAESGKNRYGPLRAPAHLRSTVRWDYQPDICKDYKETGFCGFGDSCKFLHDRSDYKHGWQLEREMEQGTYGAKDEQNYEISSDEDDLPFKCFICRNSFKDPVTTKCKHYFCEKCALGHYKKSKRCFVCGEPTGGIFNPAKDVIAKMEKVKQNEMLIPDDERDESEDFVPIS
ncbi:E3 ubiquitin-protein ligase RNF113A-like [Biomphalaria glabrata]|uniref:E3 ubiquitin-protein ligase RNF113A-like n=1 Tax=Biomphalaria glabrata TaxID=6526 RepID=A0A9W3AIU7_BIOGL|nr:E3 ubiquitin-protein ligase RNF113A-like [Biomphalaria glabrata]